MDGTPIDLDKLRSIAYLGGGRTRNRVVERRDDRGRLMKSTTDELGATVTEHWHDRQDVAIRPAPIKAHIDELRELRRGTK